MDTTDRQMPATGFLPSTLTTIGQSLTIVADGNPIMKPGGIMISWADVVARSGSDVTWLDGVTVKIGEKGLRYGQCMCEITGGEIIALAMTAGSGNVTITVNGEIATVAFDANAAAIDTALESLPTVGAGKVAVMGASPNFTLTFDPTLGDVVVSATGATATTTSVSGRDGYFGPYDPAAVDGRQSLIRGRCFWLPFSVRENDSGSLYAPGLEGGRVFWDRLIQSGVAAHSLTAGPTEVEVMAAFPDLRFVR